tara:strand:- start:212152 stop:213648 length:1497 start_codon:yes stop_codon:yes gene_type:complete
VKWLAGVAVVGLIVAGAFVLLYLTGDADPTGERATGSDAAAGETADGAAESTIVTLSAEKLAAAEIRSEPVARQTLTHRHSVPGRVAYNDNLHIAVTAPTDGILTQVLLKPGDRVQAGQVLGWLNSSEIGTARADVLLRQHDADRTASLAERARTLAANVTALTGALKGSPDFDVLKKQFADRQLGSYRDELFGALSSVVLAESLERNSAELAASGVLSGKAVQERQAAVQAGRARLEAACEQAGFDVWKSHDQAAATAADAQRRLEIARQHLASLLMSDDAIHSTGNKSDASALGANDDDLEQLSRVAVRAPFAGTIESRTFSASERVHAADSLFVLADTSTLWITAEIRENDWPAVAVEAGQTLSVNVPALGDATLQARVDFIGREVSLDTNAIPIVAVIDNADGRLRPGLFVRVSVPVGVKVDVLAVPDRSVLQHDGRSFVFVADGGNQFRRVDVEPGDDGDGYIEIVSGLNVGNQVVTHGAFILKSELLLEGEE